MVEGFLLGSLQSTFRIRKKVETMKEFTLTPPEINNLSLADFNLRAPEPLPSRSAQRAAASTVINRLGFGERAAAGLRRPNLQEDLFTQQRRLF
jgi:hypothetical protein